MDQNTGSVPPNTAPSTPQAASPITPASPAAEPQSAQNSQQPPQPKSSLLSKTKLVLLLLVLMFIGMIAVVYTMMNSTLKSATNAPAVTQAPTQMKEVVIGTDATFPPMESEDESGQLIGYDVDLANNLGKELGTTVKIENMPWDNLFTALEEQKVDMIISAVTITDERKQIYDFSDPYLNAGQVIITRKENTTILSPTNLSGKRVGVQQGTTLEQEAEKYTNLVVRFKDNQEVAKALNSGQIDAMITDLPNAKGIVSGNPNLKIAGDPFTYEYYGIVFKKGNTEFSQKVNQALTTLNQKGILEDLKQKWFE